MVQQALSQRVDEGVAELRRLELLTLDALQVGVWERALAGEVTAVRAVLRIIDSRCRLLGLTPDGASSHSQGSPQTVVQQSA